jgi:excisionase family DNA binding protein
LKKEQGPEEALTLNDFPLSRANATNLAYAGKVSDSDYPPKFELFTPRQAAALLGVTCQTVKNYIYKGKLKTFKTAGGHHRIHREHIMELGFRRDEPSRGEILEIYNHLHQGFINTLEALTDALDARDGIACGHSRRVANYVASLTEIMGISGEDQDAIKLGALLHDVGKVFISEDILSKPGRLTDQEYYLIRQHPEIGERVVSRVEFLRLAKPFIRHHHERFDGQGYPDGLAGEEIPLGARMIFVADAFDRITSDCTYEQARDLTAATDEIESNTGTQFDPEIVRIFLEEVVSKLHDKHDHQPTGPCVFQTVRRSEQYQYPFHGGHNKISI